MNPRPFAVGRNCDAWCTRCKMELAHTIVAMVDALPVKVICNTCGSEHKYRGPKAVAGTRTRSTSDAPSRSSASSSASKSRTTKAEREAADNQRELRRQWDEMLARTAGTEQVPYNVKADYTAGDVLEHPKFGLGFVLEETAFNRIKVLFQDAERVLVARHGKKPEE
ncbi:MAG: hypothetical protein EP329_27875 [Deltaproteobacteria bacterium]|nr:MAG: hypothetical protein EP329_27875 [Deltaproteobacteria bacterium]